MATSVAVSCQAALEQWLCLAVRDFRVRVHLQNAAALM
jgi:hypothetical protein